MPRLRAPSFKKVDPLARRGGSTFQKRRLARECVREKKDPSERAKKAQNGLKLRKSPLEAKARLPQDVIEAVRFIAGNGSDAI